MKPNPAGPYYCDPSPSHRHAAGIDEQGARVTTDTARTLGRCRFCARDIARTHAGSPMWKVVETEEATNRGT